MNDVTASAAGAAIGDLVHLYALNVRRGRAAACGALFTADATFTIRTLDMTDPDAAPRILSILTGGDAITDHFARAAGSDVRVVPAIHNLLIQIDGRAARSDCLMTSLSWPAGAEVFGQYEDRFRQESDGWRFRARTFTRFLSAPLTGSEE